MIVYKDNGKGQLSLDLTKLTSQEISDELYEVSGIRINKKFYQSKYSFIKIISKKKIWTYKNTTLIYKGKSL